MDELTYAIMPLITQLATLVILGVLSGVGLKVRQYFGLKGEEVWREALRSALDTGVELALEKAKSDLPGAAEDALDIAAREVLDYVKKSVPEAIAGLKGSDDVLLKKAQAHLKQLGRFTGKTLD